MCACACACACACGVCVRVLVRVRVRVYVDIGRSWVSMYRLYCVHVYLCARKTTSKVPRSVFHFVC